MKNKQLLYSALMVLSTSAVADTGRIYLGEFSKGDLTSWERKQFSGTTQYQIQQQGKRRVLHAQANTGASGLGRRMRIDLMQTPYLQWSWKVDQPLPPLKEATKAGDDYAARVYVIIDGGLFVWKTRALNYVWSSRAASKGSQWNNAFAPRNARMLALRDQRDPITQWVSEKRNVAADFKALYGFTPRFIDAVAIMTDTDNSQGSAAATYGDIFFSKQ